MAPARKRAADYTGKLTEKLNEEKALQLKEASSRMALVTAAEEEAKNDVIDYSGSSDPIPEVEVRAVEVNTPYAMIRVNTNIQQMTFGREVLDSGDYDNPDINLRRPAVMGPMRMFDFEEGQLYRVPRDVANHLNEKGYLSYMGG